MGHRRATGRGLVRVACGSGGLSGTSVCAQGLERQERRKHRPPHAGLRLGPQPLREPPLCTAPSPRPCDPRSSLSAPQRPTHSLPLPSPPHLCFLSGSAHGRPPPPSLEWEERCRGCSPRPPPRGPWPARPLPTSCARLAEHPPPGLRLGVPTSPPPVL